MLLQVGHGPDAEPEGNRSGKADDREEPRRLEPKLTTVVRSSRPRELPSEL
jgi:hypothetical protein